MPSEMPSDLITEGKNSKKFSGACPQPSSVAKVLPITNFEILHLSVWLQQFHHGCIGQIFLPTALSMIDIQHNYDILLFYSTR